MPANMMFTIPGGNPPAPGDGEVGYNWDSTAKTFKIFDGTTLYILTPNGVSGASTVPLSGTAGTGAGTFAAPGIIYRSTTNGVAYVNEGTLASPYWTPVSFTQNGLVGVYTDWRDGVGTALAATTTTVTVAGSGVRLHGQGIDETDSGVVITIGETGPIATVTTTDEAEHLVNLSFGTNADGGPFQPDTHGPLVIDATLTMSAALTLRRWFFGFIGTAADALDPPTTGSTTTITLVQDDLFGMYYDAGLTAATTIFAPFNKSDAAATITATQATMDTSTAFAAAGTYVRYRVEIAANGTATCFINKTLVHTKTAAVDVDEELYPACLVASTSSAVKSMLVRQFATWGSHV